MPESNDPLSVVLVHGGFVDGSGWQPVYRLLRNEGYTVGVVQNPTLSLDGDVVATKLTIDAQGGLVVLVGHSYGVAVITEAGNDPNVAGLVYIAAFAPDAGESVNSWSPTRPAALGPAVAQLQAARRCPHRYRRCGSRSHAPGGSWGDRAPPVPGWPRQPARETPERKKREISAGPSRLTIPVLAVGARSGEFPHRTMAQVADDVTPITLQGVGHYAAMEAPDALAAVLLDFYCPLDASATLQRRWS